jgi:photosystem II stability/assembly factor-like uncharacterized protein
MAERAEGGSQVSPDRILFNRSGLLLGLWLWAGALGASDLPQKPADKPADPYAALSYRFIGPPGNRVSAVVGVPGDLNTYYAGAASGGVWKSTDAGIHWKPIFDDEPAQSIGAIAIAPSDPATVWVGTGETFIRSNVSIGNGVYKSTDAGKTWTHMGLERTGRIGRVIIDPEHPDTVFVAALGTCYGPQQERGVFRTKDGGKTWERVLFVDELTGASDLAMDPTNPRVLFAGTWQIDIKTWGRKSGGPGSGIYVTRDGGTTWTHITGHGLPEPPLGKIAVGIGTSDPERVYALIETGQRGSLWRSDDGGEHFHLVNNSRLLNERPHYYTRMLVMPDNANEVYFPSNGMGATYDGGETSQEVRWGGDNHDMWADPKIPSRMMIGNDLGILISTTRGREWSALRLPIGQIYHVTTDNRIPYYVYGQMQDDGSMRGPSNVPGSFGIVPAQWTSTAGCETGWATPDPTDPTIVWGGCYAGVVERFDAKTGMTRTVSVWPERTMGANAGQVKLRMNWTFPIAISPHDHNTVYVGSQYVHATSDGGQTWRAISPDLTLNDKSMMGDSGGLTVDNLSVEYAGVVYSIAESPLEKGVIWAGTNDGLVQVTRDGGEHWTNATPNIPGLPPKGTVASVDPSSLERGTCYVSVDLHQVDNRDPFIFKTTDYGKTWRSISSNIPKSPLSYVHVVREDPFRKGLLYAGTENALYASFDDGAHWEPLQGKLPHAPVYWLTVQPHFHDLVVGTYGRGFFILDDVTPLEQLTDEIRESLVRLFEPRPAYRFRSVSRPNLAPVGTTRGKNPTYGASINYWLKTPLKEEGEKAKGEERRDPIEISILDASGQTLRNIKGTNKKGMNRVYWDLRLEPSEEVRMRTTPEGNPHIWEEKRFKGKDHRKIFYYGIEAPSLGPLVAPGTYLVKLRVEDKVYEQKLEVRKDPNSTPGEAQIAESAKFLQSIYRDTNEAARIINRIEWTRKQLEDLRKMLAAQSSARDASTAEALKKAAAPDQEAAQALEKRAREVEDALLQPTLAEDDQKSFRGPLQTYMKLLWLQGESGSGGGDVSGNADYPPTHAELEVYDLLHAQLKDAAAKAEELYGKTIPAFNEAMRAKGYFELMTVKEPEASKHSAPAEEDDDDDSGD